MATYPLLVFIYATITTADADISPTISNSTGDYYISSLSSESFKYDTIHCESLNCNIICDTTYGCQGTNIVQHIPLAILNVQCIEQSSCYYGTINADQSSTLTLDCQGQASCIGVVLIEGSKDKVNIECNGIDGACENAEFHASTSDNVTVFCGNSNSCQSTQFYINNSNHAYLVFNGDYSTGSAYVYGSFINSTLTVVCYDDSSCPHIYCPINAKCNIECLSKYSCYDSKIYVPDRKYDYLNLTCNNEGCNNMRIECMNSGMDDILSNVGDCGGNYPCCGSYECCAFDRNNIVCPDGIDCIINCTVDGNCLNANINAENAKSLTLYCSARTSPNYFQHVCGGSNIQCPNTFNSSCNIFCTECEYSVINITSQNINTININCSTDLANACNGMILTAYNVDIIESLSITCTIDNCRGHQYYLNDVSIINNVDIICIDTSACEYITFYGPKQYIISMNLYCTDRACENMNIINLNIYNDFHIQCVGDFACESVNFDLILMDNTNGNIECDKNPSITPGPTVGACLDSTFIISGSNTVRALYRNNNISISCNQYDCQSTQFTLNNINNVDVECFAPYSCIDMDLYGGTSNNMDIHCRQSSSCDDSNIQCPPQSFGKCIMECTSSKPDSCNGINIYYSTANPIVSPSMKPTLQPIILESTTLTPIWKDPTDSPTIRPTTVISATPTKQSMDKQSSSNNIGIIIAGVIGGILFIGILIVIIFVFRKKLKSNITEKYTELYNTKKTEIPTDTK